MPEIIELADVSCTRRKRGIRVNSTESIQLIGVQFETKLITHDDIVLEIVRVGIASAARMLLLLSKCSPREREQRELREIERGGGYYLPSQRMKEREGMLMEAAAMDPEINECVWWRKSFPLFSPLSIRMGYT